jgi:homoserine kinase type II
MSRVVTVYVLQRLRESTDSEVVKLLGVYSSRGAAEAAVDRFRDKPGFRDYPAGFHIDPYVLDSDQWTEGFGVPHPVA